MKKGIISSSMDLSWRIGNACERFCDEKVHFTTKKVIMSRKREKKLEISQISPSRHDVYTSLKRKCQNEKYRFCVQQYKFSPPKFSYANDFHWHWKSHYSDHNFRVNFKLRQLRAMWWLSQFNFFTELGILFPLYVVKINIVVLF